MSDAQKVTLGPMVRTPAAVIPRPSSAPSIRLMSMYGWTVKVVLRDLMSSASRGLPAG